MEVPAISMEALPYGSWQRTAFEINAQVHGRRISKILMQVPTAFSLTWCRAPLDGIQTSGICLFLRLMHAARALERVTIQVLSGQDGLTP
jgi:hypothetical protein